MAIGDRIKLIRKKNKLNQRIFASSIKIGQSTLAMFERGQRVPKDIHIEQICTRYNVNMEWLRTGNGNMFMQPTENELTEQAAILLRQGDPLFEAFIKYYLLLDTDGRETILKIAKDFSNHFAAELKAKESGGH